MSDYLLRQGRAEGQVRASASSFTKERPRAIRNSPLPNQCVGSATLYINDEKAGALDEMVTKVGKLAPCGEGLSIAGDGGAPLSDDDPNGQPWAFTGGTIKRLIVAVTGEPYLDLEKKALAMLSRE